MKQKKTLRKVNKIKINKINNLNMKVRYFFRWKTIWISNSLSDILLYHNKVSDLSELQLELQLQLQLEDG